MLKDIRFVLRTYRKYKLEEAIESKRVKVCLRIVKREDIPSCVRKKYPKKKPRKLTKPT